ncbi:MAG: peptidylprolyl isomerase [Ignavibacteria bacterium]|nr:peptidylprolyl isomerase [Ignavibacteria bacterium]
MPMMTRLREIAPAFITTIGVLFILFMVFSDSRIAEILGAHKTNVGSINSKDISYQEFNKFVDQARQNQKESTGKDIDEENIDQFRDQVWDAVVSKELTDRQMEKFGIKVSDKELQEAIIGPNPPDFLKRGFIDSTGRFLRDAYLTALRDPRNKPQLLKVETFMREQMASDKLMQFVNTAVNVSDAEIKRRFIDQNVRMTADYVLVDANAFADKDVQVSADEMKDYYKAHPEKFKVEDQRKIKFVHFPIAATKNDTNLVRTQLENLVEKIKSDTISFKEYVGMYSEAPYSKDTLDLSQLPENIVSVFSGVQSGTVVGPLASPAGYGVYKYLGSSDSKDPIVRASHILVKSTGNDAADLAQANKVYEEAVKGNFAEVAAKYSADPGSVSKGGDLGWFGKGRMIKEFEDACFGGTVGSVQKPIKTNFGYHIIKVTAKSTKRYAVEKIVQSVKPSPTTREQIYKKAADFAFTADKNGYEKQVAEDKLVEQESAPFTEDAFAVPGVGYNKAIVHFAFDNSVNTISPAFRVGQSYIVFRVSEVIKPGVKKYEEVEKEVKAMVLHEKKMEKAKQMAENLKKQIGTDFAKASQISGQARVGNAAQFSPNGSVPGVGLDYNFAAEAYKAQLNQVTGPVKGVRGYYLINVKEKNGFDQKAYDTQWNALRDQIIAEKKQMLFSQWLAKLKETAKIKDHRYQFYQQ